MSMSVLPQLALPEHIGQRAFEDAAAAATGAGSASGVALPARAAMMKSPRRPGST